MVGVELHNLGHVELHRGEVASAEQLFAERRELRNADVATAGIVLDPDDRFELDWLRGHIVS